MIHLLLFLLSLTVAGIGGYYFSQTAGVNHVVNRPQLDHATGQYINYYVEAPVNPGLLVGSMFTMVAGVVGMIYLAIDYSVNKEEKVLDGWRRPHEYK